MFLTAPAPNLSQLQLPSVGKPTGTALPIRGAITTNGAGSVESSHTRIPEPVVASCECLAEEAERIVCNSNSEGGEMKERGKESVQSLPERGDVARMEPSDNDRLPTKDANKSDDEAEGLMHVTTKKRASTSEESNASTSLRVATSDQPDSEIAKEEEIQTVPSQRHLSEGADMNQERRREPPSAVEVHPESRAKPSVGFAEPAATSRPASESITPAVSPDEEEESPAQSVRPRTLNFISEKYSGLLNHSYRPGSTSSSSDIESPLYAARKKLLNQSEYIPRQILFRTCTYGVCAVVS